jgi:hypothetical protein
MKDKTKEYEIEDSAMNDFKSFSKIWDKNYKEAMEKKMKEEIFSVRNPWGEDNSEKEPWSIQIRRTEFKPGEVIWYRRNTLQDDWREVILGFEIEYFEECYALRHGKPHNSQPIMRW